MQRAGSQGRGDGAAAQEEQELTKREFVDNLHKLMHFYNKLQEVNPQFNPINEILQRTDQ